MKDDKCNIISNIAFGLMI